MGQLYDVIVIGGGHNGLVTPLILPKQGRKSSCWNAATSSAVPLSPKKSSPAFFFPSVLTSSRSSVLKLFANSIFLVMVWKFFLSTAPSLPCPAAITSGA